jgi:hypothetical protein
LLGKAFKRCLFPSQPTTWTGAHSTPNHCHDLRQCRTIEDIIWSCVVTIFVSTWITLHLNIPAPEEKWHAIVLRKVGIMALALIAPEVVVMWAMR